MSWKDPHPDEPGLEYGENAPDITADRIARAHQQYEGALQIQTDRVFGCCCCKWTSLVTSEISWRSLFFRACTHTSGYVGVCVRASSLLPANAPNNAGGEFYSPMRPRGEGAPHPGRSAAPSGEPITCSESRGRHTLARRLFARHVVVAFGAGAPPRRVTATGRGGGRA